MSIFQDQKTMMLVYGVTGAVVLWIIWKVLLESNPLEARLRAVSQRRRELNQKVKELPTGRRQKEKKTQKDKQKQISFIKRIVGATKLQKKNDHSNELRIKLLRAGYRSRDALAVFLFIKLISMAGIGFLAFSSSFIGGAFKAKAAMGILGVLTAALFGWFLPNIIIKNKAQSRRNLLRKALPDALDLMVICAEAGLSLDAALERVSREVAMTSPELAEEFGLTSVELSLLPERSKALQNLTERVDLQGILSLVNTLIQTERYGTPLAQALRVLASEMREERMMKAEEKAARLPATMTVPMILFILPTLFIIIIGPAAVKVMSTTSGH